MNISKSLYARYRVCPKLLWLFLNKPQESEPLDSSSQKRIEDGKAVGKVARSYFPGTVDVTVLKPDGSLDLATMLKKTEKHLLQGNVTIAEASFSVEHLFCSVDLLHPVDGGYDIYEVKATTKVKDDHVIDSSFQKFVLQKAGLSIKNVYILHLNSDYIRHGEIDVQKLFVKEKMDDLPLFINTIAGFSEDLDEITKILGSKDELQISIDQRCKTNQCPYIKYCHAYLPKPNILDLNNLKGRYDKLHDGIVTFEDALFHDIPLNKRQKVQIQAELSHLELIVDKDAVRAFLKTVTYPIYHLDFETIQEAIPPFDNASPYAQIPFQYSLHIEHKDGTLEHREFLGHTLDCRRALAEQLCKDIPLNVTTMAYNSSFEETRIQELADLYPDLSEHLLHIKEHMIDLIAPFKAGDYYHYSMGGSNSIKTVLPALYPSDLELDYHALPGVKNGGEAMAIYPIMIASEESMKTEIREGLLKYCGLDTLAMVKVLRKLSDSLK